MQALDVGLASGPVSKCIAASLECGYAVIAKGENGEDQSPSRGGNSPGAGGQVHIDMQHTTFK